MAHVSQMGYCRFFSTPNSALTMFDFNCWFYISKYSYCLFQNLSLLIAKNGAGRWGSLIEHTKLEIGKSFQNIYAITFDLTQCIKMVMENLCSHSPTKYGIIFQHSDCCAVSKEILFVLTEKSIRLPRVELTSKMAAHTALPIRFTPAPIQQLLLTGFDW